MLYIYMTMTNTAQILLAINAYVIVALMASSLVLKSSWWWDWTGRHSVFVCVVVTYLVMLFWPVALLATLIRNWRNRHG